MSSRRSVGLVLSSASVFECLLLLIAFAGYGTQGDVGQDEPIAFGAILVAILGAGDAVGLFIAVLVYAVMSHRRRHRL